MAGVGAALAGGVLATSGDGAGLGLAALLAGSAGLADEFPETAVDPGVCTLGRNKTIGNAMASSARHKSKPCRRVRQNNTRTVVSTPSIARYSPRVSI
jgi:hypothetical protein